MLLDAGNQIAAVESEFGLPDVAAGIHERLGRSGFDLNDAARYHRGQHCRRNGLRCDRRGWRRTLIIRLAASHERQNARSGTDTDGLSWHVSLVELLVVCSHWAVMVMGNFSGMSSDAAPTRNS